MQGMAAEDHGVGFGTARADLQEAKESNAHKKEFDNAAVTTSETDTPCSF